MDSYYTHIKIILTFNQYVNNYLFSHQDQTCFNFRALHVVDPVNSYLKWHCNHILDVMWHNYVRIKFCDVNNYKINKNRKIIVLVLSC